MPTTPQLCDFCGHPSRDGYEVPIHQEVRVCGDSARCGDGYVYPVGVRFVCSDCETIWEIANRQVRNVMIGRFEHRRAIGTGGPSSGYSFATPPTRRIVSMKRTIEMEPEATANRAEIDALTDAEQGRREQP